MHNRDCGCCYGPWPLRYDAISTPIFILREAGRRLQCAAGHHSEGDAMDPYNLQRFVDAQDGAYARVQAELAAGCKTSHWMWFIFPQIAGLGHSATAQKYAISSLGEAQAYLGHEVLGSRLRDCTRLVTAVNGRSIEDIFGYPDHLKFHSSMTLFAQGTDENQIFMKALDKYWLGKPDKQTIELLKAES
jgi:uncharacterized protein (DUF1810 family)